MVMILNRGGRLALGVLAAAIAIVGVKGVLSPTQAQQVSPDAPAMGQALVDQLGLEVLPSEPPGCVGWFTVEGESGYCLDQYAHNEVEFWTLVWRLRGIVPTDLQTRWHVLQGRLGEVVQYLDSSQIATDPRFVDLRQQLVDLRAEMQSAHQAPLTG
jgi:hypothetical protein